MSSTLIPSTPNAVSARVSFDDDPSPALAVHAMSARFALSELYQIDLEVEALDGHVDLEGLPLRPVTVVLPNGMVLRAMVAAVHSAPGRDDPRWIVMRVVPHAWISTQYFDQFIFEHTTLLDITNECLITEGPHSTVAHDELVPPPEPREYTTQFDELDWDLLLRLWAADGVTTFFEPSSEEERLVLTNDTTRSCRERQVTVPFRATEGVGDTEAAIRSVRLATATPLSNLRETRKALERADLRVGASKDFAHYPGGDVIVTETQFWTAPETGHNSQAGTLVHEASHMGPGAKDWRYGTDRCEELARTDPPLAANNADSIEYFVEEWSP